MRRASRRPPGRSGRALPTRSAWRSGERHLAAEFGADVVDHRTYVLASDGDLMEGISQEAIALAGRFKLGRLIVLFDDNGISIDGPLRWRNSVDQVASARAYGWNACRIDGHDADAIAAAIAAARPRIAEPDRLPHRDRLRRAAEAGSEEVARLAARTRGGRGQSAKARLDIATVRGCRRISAAASRRDGLAFGAARQSCGSSGSRASPPTGALNSIAGSPAICRAKRSPPRCAA